jgi:nitroreductase
VEFSQIVRGRRSIKKYEPNVELTDDELRAIFNQVVLSPSSFNIQHWRFVVVRDNERKKVLRAAAFNQEQVETASAVVVVLGKLNAYQDAAEIYAEAPESVRNSVVPMIQDSYKDAPAKQRDEAIRSGALAAMTLMYAAYDRGWDSGPMIGFEPDKVREIIHADEQHLPVMLVVIGRRSKEPRPRAFRFPLDRVVKREALDGRGL